MTNARGLTTLFLLLSTLFSAPCARAISETGYATTLAREVEPFVREHLQTGSFLGVDGVRITYGTLAGGTRGTVVLVPGRTEWSGTFTELIYDLAKRGYSVAVIDHRGQGHSGRLVPGRDVGYVEHFEDYVDDFDNFLDRAVFGRLPGPYYLLGDSMGGAISILYLAKHPDAFAAVALAAPMINIQTSPFSEPVAFGLASFLRGIGFGTSYAPTTKAHDFAARFEDNNFTHSRARFLADMERVGGDPITATGGPSVNWVYEALQVSRRLPAVAAQIAAPLLLFEAGADYFVVPSAQDDFCGHAPRCSIVKYPQAYHSLLIETDPVRGDLLGRALTHFERNGTESLARSFVRILPTP